MLTLFHSTKNWYIWQVWRNCLSFSLQFVQQCLAQSFVTSGNNTTKKLFCFNVRSSKIGSHSNVTDPTSFFFVVLYGKTNGNDYVSIFWLVRHFLSTLFVDTFRRHVPPQTKWHPSHVSRYDEKIEFGKKPEKNEKKKLMIIFNIDSLSTSVTYLQHQTLEEYFWETIKCFKFDKVPVLINVK